MNRNSVREEYRRLGVAEYYRQHGGDYRNPHFPQVRELLRRNEGRIDYRQALDFCCGSGEVSLVLRELGYEPAAAADPFTSEAYTAMTGLSCLPLYFHDVVRGGLDGHYSAIICSFAMHLCPDDQLFMLCYQLFRHTGQLIIITPHKRPALERLDGFTSGSAMQYLPPGANGSS